MLETYLSLLDEAYFEIGEAFKGLEDTKVWKRPTPQLLSIGEIAGHVAYWEAVKFAGDSGMPKADLTKCNVQSPLIDHRFRYYTSAIAADENAQRLLLSAQQVYDELMRVHQESMAYFRTLDLDLNSHPHGWPGKMTYKDFLSYSPIHVAYHTGQIYSVRHLFGDETADN
jgi:hypothetical protein